MRTSSCNQLRGTVIATKLGPLSAEVNLSINHEGRMTAPVTRESQEQMGLKEGRDAYAMFMASSVILVPLNEGLRTSAQPPVWDHLAYPERPGQHRSGH